MYQLLILLILVLGAIPAHADSKTFTGDEETLYAVGLVMARQISVFNLTPAEFDIVKQGLTDGVTGKTPVEQSETFSSKIKVLAQSRRDAPRKDSAAGTKALLENALREKGAVKTASGLVYLPRLEGTGPHPSPKDLVTVHYRGTLVDGQEFDNSFRRGQPLTLPLGSGSKCWTEGIAMMRPGGKARLICPPELAFGKSGSGIVPTEATVVYDVEFVGVITP
jgi:FKBP-type peptidyl-prolyl cis-trans isomerase FkpA